MIFKGNFTTFTTITHAIKANGVNILASKNCPLLYGPTTSATKQKLKYTMNQAVKAICKILCSTYSSIPINLVDTGAIGGRPVGSIRFVVFLFRPNSTRRPFGCYSDTFS